MSGSSESPTVSPDLSGITAPLLFGPAFNWALYGILCTQIYIYSYNFPNDRLSIKFIAYFIFLIETVQTALTGSDLFFWFVAGFGEPARLADSYLSPLDVPIMTGVISFTVQGYFCYRIGTLNRWTSRVCWIIAVAAVIQSVSTTAAGIKSFVLGGKYVSTKTALCVWSISSALADVLIAAAMILLLRRAKGKFSNYVLFRVVQLTIETNALTATLAITILVLYTAFPNELYYVAVTEIIGKVYSNTLLLNLNNRIYFRDSQLPFEGSTYLGASGLDHANTSSSSHHVSPELPSQDPKGTVFLLCPLSRPTHQET